MSGLTKAERETILRWSDDPEEPLSIYTHREKAAKKLIRAGATLIRTASIGGRPISWTLACPREWARWPRKPRGVSDALRARLQDARSRRKALSGARPDGGNSGSEGGRA